MSDPTASQPDPEAPRRQRRERYSGKNPRRFADKYKELDPQRYPELIAHVRSRGATPAGQHVPILVDEVLEALAPRPGDLGVDATLGWGGHAQRLLERIAPQGRLLALDADPLESAKTLARLGACGFQAPALEFRRTNFASLAGALAELGWSEGVDFVFADLGLSSMQIDDPRRGFSFKHEGPLDMRMNPRRGLSAGAWLEQATQAELVRVLVEHADEPQAARIARELEARRGELQTTTDLAACVREALAGAEPGAVEASVRRVFQAVRIEVNDEFGALEGLLRQLGPALRSGGRVALLSFHSGEDRRIKQSFQRGLAAGIYDFVAPSVVRPSAAERRDNPRSGPAKLRWAVRR